MIFLSSATAFSKSHLLLWIAGKDRYRKCHFWHDGDDDEDGRCTNSRATPHEPHDDLNNRSLLHHPARHVAHCNNNHHHHH